MNRFHSPGKTHTSNHRRFLNRSGMIRHMNAVSLLQHTSLAVIAIIVFLTQPLRAQTGGRPLGGPTLDVGDINSAINVHPVNNTAPYPNTNKSSGKPVGSPQVTKKPEPSNTKRLAQAQTNAGTAAESAASNTVAGSQGNLPIDLGAIKRLKVGDKLIDESLVRVGNLDILAPIVTELSVLGASVTRASVTNLPGNPNTPSEDKNFQINLPQGDPVVLTVGNSNAYIKGVQHALRAAPLVIREKIWLPLFSLAPLLGASTRLEPDGTLHLNPTIQSVELFTVKDTIALTIKASAPLPERGVLMGTLDDPPKLYLDFPGYSMGFDAANSTGERIVAAGVGNVQRVRAGMFQSFPDITRVVLDLKKELKGVAQPLPDRTLFALLLVEPGRIPTRPAGFNPGPSGPNSLRGLTIVVDAGHGGHDNGAPGTRSMEKNLTLDIARRVRDQLFARGATVLMSRDGDYFVSLQGRVDFANSRKADIFFSVHINSYQRSSTGTETYYYTAPSLALAREVHKELVKATGLKNRGVIQERFFVIRKTWMPSVLTECAFISNPNDEALLVNPAWRQRVAQGMAQGIVNYVNVYLRGNGIAG